MSLAVKIAWSLTLSRLVLAPIWLGIFFLAPGASVWPLLLAVFIELTDVLDGYFSRNASSALGAVLDPLADSLFHLLAMLAMGLSGFFPVWWVLPLLYRESLVAGVETVASIQGRPCFSLAREVWKSRMLATTTLLLLAQRAWHGPQALTWTLLGLQSAYCIGDGLFLLATQWKRLISAD